MFRRSTFVLVLLALILGTLGVAGVTAQSEASSYVVIANSTNQIPASLLQEIRAAGGVVNKQISQLGLVFVSSRNPNFESLIRSARGVAPSIPMRVIEPERIEMVSMAEFGNPPTSGDDDTRFDLQWGMDAINAPEIWEAGYRGAGATIAILDEGVDADHPDLVGQVDFGASTSLVAGEDWNPEPGFYFNHGTHVAGIAAAADNAVGTIGVAPEAKIIAVQVLSRNLGYGLDEWVIGGIKHAADVGADVINMSLGSGPLDIRGACTDPEDPESCYTTQDIIELGWAYKRVVDYAHARGAVVIASAGNDGVNFSADPYLYHLPSDVPGIISVSALGPLNWAADPTTNLDVQTSYTNYGWAIDLSAPGGNFDYPGNEECTVVGLVRPCWVFDMVFAPIPGGFSWAAGTSMAAPHVAGAAAVIISAYRTTYGSNLTPSQVEQVLKRVADDLGPAGRDDVFGSGRLDLTIED
jgi:subtilisin family serine protease